MDLQQTKEAFIVWVESCKTEEQLRLLEEIADEFISKRFSSQVPDVIAASAEVSHALYLQKETIVINCQIDAHYN